MTEPRVRSYRRLPRVAVGRRSTDRHIRAVRPVPLVPPHIDAMLISRQPCHRENAEDGRCPCRVLVVVDERAHANRIAEGGATIRRPGDKDRAVARIRDSRIWIVRPPGDVHVTVRRGGHVAALQVTGRTEVGNRIRLARISRPCDLHMILTTCEPGPTNINVAVERRGQMVVDGKRLFVFLSTESDVAALDDHGLVVRHAGRRGDVFGHRNGIRLRWIEIRPSRRGSLEGNECKEQVPEVVEGEPRIAGGCVASYGRGKSFRRSVAREAGNQRLERE